MRIALEERREAMRIASEEQRELIRIKEEKNEVEKRKMEDELMMKDTRTMDPKQKEYIHLCRLEILERLRSKYASYNGILLLTISNQVIFCIEQRY